MLRLAWKTLATVTLLALLYIIGYAAVGITGPESVSQRAQAAYDQGRNSDCIKLCNAALAEIAPDAVSDLRERILTLRGEAYHKIDDLKFAIEDFRAVRDLDPSHPQKTARLVHSLIADRQPEIALEITREFLASDPTDMRLQELSGEAEQMIYQDLIRDFRQDLEMELGPRDLEAAIDAIRPWLYRTQSDPEAQLSHRIFNEILRNKSPRAFATQRFDTQLGVIRNTITRAMRYYWTALELKGMPVAAYQGLSYALEQGGRLDDLQALDEIFLLRFNHWRAVAAAISLTKLHLKNHRYRACVDASDRYLPLGSWKTRSESNAVRHVLDAKSEALFELSAMNKLQRMVTDAWKMHAAEGTDLRPEIFLISLRGQEAAGDMQKVDRDIANLHNLLSRSPDSPDIKIKLLAVLRRQFDTAMRLKQDKETFDRIFKTWLRIEKDQPEVHLARARYLGAIGEYAQMHSSAKNALDLDTHDEESLKAFSKAADTFYHQSSRGSGDMLLRILSLEQLVPDDISSDHLLITLAELALEQGHFEIAQACAEKATQIFNWARWPKYILIKSLLALGETEDAAKAATALLTFFPDDREGVRLLKQARESAGLPTTDLLFKLILIGEHDAEIAKNLLGYATKRQDVELEAGIAKALIELEPGNLRALDRIAMLQYAKGNLQGALDTLGAIATTAHDHNDLDATRALSRELLISILTNKDTDYSERFEVIRSHCANQPLLATDLAADLYTLGQVKMAGELLDLTLHDARHADTRNGKQFLLAARLAIDNARVFEAIAHLQSAQSFDDGQKAAEIITILQLRIGNYDSARVAIGDAPSTDFLAACLAAQLGFVDRASTWVRARLTSNPLDFDARLLAAILDPSAESSPLIRSLIDEAALEVLQLLTLLATDWFEDDALRLAKSLQSRYPQSPLSTYLHAEAQANTGKAQAALDSLAQLAAKQPQFTAAYFKTLQLLPRLATSGKPELRLLTTLHQQKHLTPPTNNLRKFVDRIPKPAIERMAQDWLRQADDLDRGKSKVNFLLNIDMPDRALELSYAMAKTGDGDVPNLWHNYLDVATMILEDLNQPALLKSTRPIALGLVQKGIAIDAAVAFLLRLDKSTAGPLRERRDTARTTQLLSLIGAHLKSAQAGQVSVGSHLAMSIETLSVLSGRSHTLAQIDELLTADPSLLEIWVLRAQWLAEEGRLAEGISGLRGILDFVPNNRAQLTAAELAAGRSEIDLRSVQAAVNKLPPQLFGSPDGRLSRGLLALRGADYQLADELLSDCAERADGSPIYYRALANLSLAKPDKARALFLDLTAKYPDSSLSVNARHFAKQLSH